MDTSISNDPAIQLRGVKIRYADAPEYALSIDELTVETGEFVAVIGPSGAGKSTFLRCINGLVVHRQGELRVFGKTYRKRELLNLRKQVSMVFQDFSLAPRMRVLDNVLVGRLAQKKGLAKVFGKFNDRDREKAFAALQKVGMLRYAMRDVRQLSGGQKQRVAIARSLAQEARIILADEPVASLDPINATRIIELLKALNEEQNITVLVNLHQVDFVEKYFSSVIGLKNGRLEFHKRADENEPLHNLTQVYG